MSTKIYEAYRTRKGTDLFRLIRDIRAKGSASAIDHLGKMLNTLRDAVTLTPELREKHLSSKLEKFQNDEFLKSYIAAELMAEGYKKQIDSPLRNPFHFDVSVAIHELDGRYYLLPYEDMHMNGTMKFLENHPSLKNYQYWNNTDQPDDVSDREWNERRKNWDAIHDRGWGNHLVLDILNKDNWYLFSPLWSLDENGKIKKDEILKMLNVEGK